MCGYRVLAWIPSIICCQVGDSRPNAMLGLSYTPYLYGEINSVVTHGIYIRPIKLSVIYSLARSVETNLQQRVNSLISCWRNFTANLTERKFWKSAYTCQLTTKNQVSCIMGHSIYLYDVCFSITRHIYEHLTQTILIVSPSQRTYSS